MYCGYADIHRITKMVIAAKGTYGKRSAARVPTTKNSNQMGHNYRVCAVNCRLFISLIAVVGLSLVATVLRRPISCWLGDFVYKIMSPSRSVSRVPIASDTLHTMHLTWFVAGKYRITQVTALFELKRSRSIRWLPQNQRNPEKSPMHRITAIRAFIVHVNHIRKHVG